MDDNEYYAADENPQIVVENLVMDYRKNPTESVRAIDGVSLSIWPGEFVAVTGPAGSGKSTLVQLLGCLDRPTSGTIIIDGEDVTKLPTNQLPRIRGEKIGFIFKAHHLVSTLTAIENVMLPLRYRKVSQDESERIAGEWLVRVGLVNKLYHRPSELSALEQQKVAIARSLVNNPIIIMADEPTGELDAAQARELIELMQGLNYNFGQTFIIATGDEDIAQMCDRIIRLRDGKVEEDTALQESDETGATAQAEDSPTE